MRTKLIVGILIAALAITGSVMLNAAPRNRSAGAAPPAGVTAGPAGLANPGAGPGCPLGPGFILGRLAKALELTNAQIAELKQIHQDFLNATATARDQLQAKIKEMLQLWSADQPDAAAIKALAADIDALRAQIRDAGIDHLVNALNVLTPAQREKLRTMLKQWAPRCISCMGCGPGLGCGLCCGVGMGPRGRMGCGMGAGAGMGPGWGNGTGPRGGTAACPLTW
ncbi:MAG: Spy/CpxP family protein refolding chaperone [Armatimonadota bacterium]